MNKQEMYLQMSTVLANLVVRLCGFHDIHDSHTEIDKQHLTNAIPYLMVIRPQLVDRYKYNIRQCYKKGIHSHRDAAKILRRILKNMVELSFGDEPLAETPVDVFLATSIGWHELHTPSTPMIYPC